MSTLFSHIGSGWFAGLFAASTAALALALAWAASRLTFHSAGWRYRIAHGVVTITAAVLAGLLAADRVSADLIDLSESAARQLTSDLQLLVWIVGILSLTTALVIPILIAKKSASPRTQRGLIAGVIVALAGSLSNFMLLRGVGSNAGVDPRLCAFAIVLGVGASTLFARTFTSPARWVLASAMFIFILAGALVFVTSLPMVISGMLITLFAMATATFGLACAGNDESVQTAEDRSPSLPGWHPLSIAGIAVVFSLLPATLQLGHFGLERAARSFVAGTTIAAPPDAPVYAVCIRPETFAVVIPAMGVDGSDLVRAAVLADRSQFASPTDLEHLEVGTIIPATPAGGDLDAKRFQLKARIAHGDHYHDYDFAVVSTAKAEPRELASAMHAHAASPALFAGIILGVGCSIMFMKTRLGPLTIGFVLLALIFAVIGGPGTSVGLILGVLPTLLRPSPAQ